MSQLVHAPFSLHLPTSPTTASKYHPRRAPPRSWRNPGTTKPLRCLAQVAVHENSVGERESRKHDLLRAAQDTQRGLVATADQRAAVEEAMVFVEGYDAGSAINLEELDGTWRLNYTSASDVLILLEAAVRLPFLFQVGHIFQKFECRDKVDGGVVRNVVRWSVPTLLEWMEMLKLGLSKSSIFVDRGLITARAKCEHEGATLLVTAKFSVVSKRNIYLQFEEVAVENIKISEELQALIAPAILPRSFLSLQILQFLKTFRAQVPVASPERRSPGGLYYLSYLDRDMLLGRAVGGGGLFVFTRAQALTS